MTLTSIISELMLQKLRSEPDKVPAPTGDDMMSVLAESWKEINLNPVSALKNNFVVNALDSSEDYLVTDKLMALVVDRQTNGSCW